MPRAVWSAAMIISRPVGRQPAAAARRAARRGDRGGGRARAALDERCAACSSRTRLPPPAGPLPRRRSASRPSRRSGGHDGARSVGERLIGRRVPGPSLPAGRGRARRRTRRPRPSPFTTSHLYRRHPDLRSPVRGQHPLRSQLDRSPAATPRPSSARRDLVRVPGSRPRSRTRPGCRPRPWPSSSASGSTAWPPPVTSRTWAGNPGPGPSGGRGSRLARRPAWLPGSAQRDSRLRSPRRLRRAAIARQVQLSGVDLQVRGLRDSGRSTAGSCPAGRSRRTSPASAARAPASRSGRPRRSRAAPGG